jgi:hypothetical protein
MRNAIPAGGMGAVHFRDGLGNPALRAACEKVTPRSRS